MAEKIIGHVYCDRCEKDLITEFGYYTELHNPSVHHCTDCFLEIEKEEASAPTKNMSIRQLIIRCTEVALEHNRIGQDGYSRIFDFLDSLPED